jgi:hypothetical protein
MHFNKKGRNTHTHTQAKKIDPWLKIKIAKMQFHTEKGGGIVIKT